MKSPNRFIVIDDDLVNNMLCSFVIKQTAGEAEIEIFNIPEEGFEFVAREYVNSENPTILFLDINMPTWSGWDFLDNFEKLDEKIKKQIRIYMLSSSLDPNDKTRAMDNRHVVDYIVKPLSKSIMRSILEDKS
jgi:two-component SAPR family response regulator